MSEYLLLETLGKQFLQIASDVMLAVQGPHLRAPHVNRYGVLLGLRSCNQSPVVIVKCNHYFVAHSRRLFGFFSLSIFREELGLDKQTKFYLAGLYIALFCWY